MSFLLGSPGNGIDVPNPLSWTCVHAPRSPELLSHTCTPPLSLPVGSPNIVDSVPVKTYTWPLKTAVASTDLLLGSPNAFWTTRSHTALADPAGPLRQISKPPVLG